MKTWFTSDTHFNHGNIIDYCDRPFRKDDGQFDIPKMNEVLTANWNSVVSPDDLVYHLGDFAMGQYASWPELRKGLNGRIILVEGNHDRKYDKWMLPGDEHHRSLLLDGHIFLTHVPPGPTDIRALVCPPIPPETDLILCGHVHTMFKERTYLHEERQVTAATGEGRLIRVINVGVDVRGFKPVSLEELLS